jgi:hypothetical protein
MAIDKKIREDIEIFICQFFDALDKTGINTEYWKGKFAHMSDYQFEQWLKKKYPLTMQHRVFEIEPTFSDFEDAAKVVGIPLLEKVRLPYLYTNKDGVAVNSKECLIIYLHLKKVQQMITKKNHISTDIDRRDFKTGRLLDEDKSAAMSDRESEALAIMGLYNTMDEFTTIKADAMNAKSQAYNQISNTGNLSKEYYTVDKADSISRNTISVYMLGCHLNTNLVNEGNYTPYTLKEKQRKVVRA